MNEVPPYSIFCCKGVLLLERIYPVFWNGKKVGDVQLHQKGLYYFLSCKCCLTGDNVCRLYADNNARQIPLGILVPDHNYYTLKMHIPSCKLNTDSLAFQVKSEEKKEITCILKTDKKVFCLSQLENARFQRDGAVCGLNFKNHRN